MSSHHKNSVNTSWLPKQLLISHGIIALLVLLAVVRLGRYLLSY